MKKNKQILCQVRGDVFIIQVVLFQLTCAMTTLFYAKRTILFFVSTGTRVTTRRILIENHNCKINFCGRQTTYMYGHKI